MIRFVDASALVAVMAREPANDSIVAKLVDAEIRLYSAMTAWEASVALARNLGIPFELARDQVASFLTELDFRFVPIGEAETLAALDAFQLYGKGRHPAALNMGDCFAYACAKANGAALLYKGDDFAQTDMADA